MMYKVKTRYLRSIRRTTVKLDQQMTLLVSPNNSGKRGIRNLNKRGFMREATV